MKASLDPSRNHRPLGSVGDSFPVRGARNWAVE